MYYIRRRGAPSRGGTSGPPPGGVHRASISASMVSLIMAPFGAMNRHRGQTSPALAAARSDGAQIFIFAGD